MRQHSCPQEAANIKSVKESYEKKIIPIAAFTANGEIEKLKTALDLQSELWQYQIMKKFSILIKCLILVVFTFGCSPRPAPVHPPLSELQAVLFKDSPGLIEKFSPVFLIEKYDQPFNLIGTPEAKINEENIEEISINPSSATIYTRVQEFTTATGQYTNLYYRVHFKEIPKGIDPFYLGAGKNTGIFVIVTLNRKHEPILYTTVNTCGCYLAFFPTSFMEANQYPDTWKRSRQDVHGESLPPYLDFTQEQTSELKLLILIREGSHRVKDLYLSPAKNLEKYQITTAQRKDIEDLNHLVRNDGQITSFFETAGSRAGYVKSSQKIFERIFMSWWALDWRVGEDKKLGINKQDGPVFYTDLRPWARNASDMRDFKTFLEHWGWRL